MNTAELVDLELKHDKEQNQLTLMFSGILNMDTIATLWESCLAAQNTYSPQLLIINADQVEYCDSAGVSLFLQLKESQLKANRHFQLTGLAEKYQRLVNLIANITVEPITPAVDLLSIPAQVGKNIVDWLAVLRKNTIYVGELCDEFVRCVFNPRRLRWQDVWRTIEIVGPDALPIVLLLGFLLGLIMSFQSAIPLQRFGAVIYIANIVSISLARELAPLLVAIILAGRTASYFAAELGTMKVNQEIDALKTMGLKPMLFLIIPRVFAVMVMTPILTIFMVVIGLLGCLLFMLGIGYSSDKK